MAESNAVGQTLKDLLKSIKGTNEMIELVEQISEKSKFLAKPNVEEDKAILTDDAKLLQDLKHLKELKKENIQLKKKNDQLNTVFYNAMKKNRRQIMAYRGLLEKFQSVMQKTSSDLEASEYVDTFRNLLENIESKLLDGEETIERLRIENRLAYEELDMLGEEEE